MDMRADVLIVGAGMVGSALAMALQGSGLQVLLLDGSPLSVKPFDRAAASKYSSPTLRPPTTATLPSAIQALLCMRRFIATGRSSISLARPLRPRTARRAE